MYPCMCMMAPEKHDRGSARGCGDDSASEDDVEGIRSLARLRSCTTTIHTYQQRQAPAKTSTLTSNASKSLLISNNITRETHASWRRQRSIFLLGLQRQASRSGMTSKAGKTLVRNTILSFDIHRLTKFRNWRHTANIARISKDPTMGPLPTLQAPKSA